MIVFRLSKAVYANDLSGRGAEISGGRWNSRGKAMLYTSESRALCTTEIAVHTPLGICPANYKLVTILIPEELKVIEIHLRKLPEEWSNFPHHPKTAMLGNDFLNEQKSAILKVPSAVVPGDFNYVINPHHKDASFIKIKKIEDFSFDHRLFKD